MTAAWLVWCTVTWLWIHLTFFRWGRGHRLDPARGAPAATTRVVIPARDEALNIEASVRAALADVDVTELIVVDDQSTDGTAQLADAAAAGDLRYRRLSAADRPAGWAGKPWACTQGAEGASTTWLLFIDADVRLAPGAIRAATSRARADHADLISLFGSWEVVTFGERLLVPAIGWLIRATLDLGQVNSDAPRRRAFANGQFILASVGAYERLGGHGAVRAEVLDDVRLAERARDHGLRARMLWAPWAFQVRLYRSAAEVARGYQKNLFEGLGRRRVVALLAAWAVFACTLQPLLVAPALWADGQRGYALWAALVVVAQVAFRARLERRDGRSPWIAAWHPVAGGVTAAIFAWSALSPTVAWKGRAFVDGKAG